MAFILDQQNNNTKAGNFNLRIASNSQVKLAESFVPSASAPLTRVTFNLCKKGSPTGNMWATIEADSSGSPSGTPLATSANVDVSTLSTDPTYNDVNFDFSSPPSLTNGTTYWIVLQGDFSFGNDVNQPKQAVSDTGVYTSGVLKAYDGSAWSSDQGYDLLFKQYRDAIASVSPSASRSPSASSSPSLSPSSSASSSISASISPSSSISPSLSPSASRSPSASNSPSGSISASLSPSGSFSSSVSASPSQGYSLFTRGNEAVLPTTIDDLETTYTEAEEAKVETRNNIYVGQEGALQYMIHQFKVFIGEAGFCQLEWEGKSTLAPSLSPVYLQVYNRATSSWQTVDSNGTADADENFELEEKLRETTNYRDSQNVVSCRVYQLAI